MNPEIMKPGPILFLVGGTGDGGGIGILNGKVIRIPPRVDKQVREVRLAVEILSVAENVKDAELSRALLQAGRELATQSAREILEVAER